MDTTPTPPQPIPDPYEHLDRLEAILKQMAERNRARLDELRELTGEPEATP